MVIWVSSNAAGNNYSKGPRTPNCTRTLFVLANVLEIGIAAGHMYFGVENKNTPKRKVKLTWPAQGKSRGYLKEYSWSWDPLKLVADLLLYHKIFVHSEVCHPFRCGLTHAIYSYRSL